MEEWDNLKALLKMDPEIEIAIQGYANLIKQRVKEAIHSKCEGCEREWASQRDHECIMNYEQLKERCIDDQMHLLNALDTLAIIVQMAKIAKMKLYVLKHPDWAIHMMRYNYMNKVKAQLQTMMESECEDQ